MTSPVKSITVPREEAVFWMDEHGLWHNEHGRFEHPKIINYFNESIRRDRDGYYVYQKAGDIEEKVYFPFQETALFVVDVIKNDKIALVLNTKQKIPLEPGCLFTRNDALYQERGDELVKFTDRALLKLADRMSDKDGGLFITVNQVDHAIESR